MGFLKDLAKDAMDRAASAITNRMGAGIAPDDGEVSSHGASDRLEMTRRAFPLDIAPFGCRLGEMMSRRLKTSDFEGNGIEYWYGSREWDAAMAAVKKAEGFLGTIAGKLKAFPFTAIPFSLFTPVDDASHGDGLMFGTLSVVSIETEAYTKTGKPAKFPATVKVYSYSPAGKQAKGMPALSMPHYHVDVRMSIGWDGEAGKVDVYASEPGHVWWDVNLRKSQNGIEPTYARCTREGDTREWHFGV